MVFMNDDAIAYLAIMRLQSAYADISTRRAWSEFAALATPDARFSFDTRSGNVIEVVGAVAFGEFGAKMIDRFSFYEYMPLNFVVTIATDGTARGRSYALEVGEDRDTGDWIGFYGFYHDDYALFDGTWRFARRQYQTLARRTGDRLEAFPLQAKEMRW
jgi:SnoaL-like domain